MHEETQKELVTMLTSEQEESATGPVGDTDEGNVLACAFFFFFVFP
jgi:hypothetical protein